MRFKSGDDLIAEIARRADRIEVVETYSREFEDTTRLGIEKLSSFNNNGGRGKNLRVTDVINPIFAYLDILEKPVKNPPELEVKFNYGRFIEGKVEAILRKEREFTVSQGNIDGSRYGMPDVRGRSDFRIGDRIIEFKTSEYDIASSETLTERNPQDLEQLLLYVLFTGREAQDHRLLYLIGRYPNLSAREFKVKIKNKEEILQYFQGRIQELKDAIASEDTSKLGRCRYYTSICKFKETGICHCDQKQPIDITSLLDNVYVARYSGDLEGIISERKISGEKAIGIWDLFAPRRWFSRETVNSLSFLRIASTFPSINLP